MRLATFNLENLDLPPKSHVPFETRLAVLRPALARLDADVLCLQEVNAQHVPVSKERQLLALERLLEGTPYERFNRVSTTNQRGGEGPADVHNLVTLSRFPIAMSREIRHQFVEPASHVMLTGDSHGAQPVRFERPLLETRITLPDGATLIVFNLHLRAPLASAIAGEKLGAFGWRSVRGWAEGYYLSALKRTGQALELRLVVDEILSLTPDALIALAGDFNAEDHETPLRLVLGATDDTGSSALASQSLVLLDRALPQDRRWSVLHAGRPQMLDHILASQALYGRFRAIEVHNEALGDEKLAYEKHIESAGSSHAGVVAELNIEPATDALSSAKVSKTCL